MTRISRLRIRIPGEYRDAWLYKGHLYAWGRDGAMFQMELDRAYNHISNIHGPELANAANVLAFRNDWKHGQQFRSFMKSPEMEKAFLRPFNDTDSLTIELPAGLLTKSESEGYSGVVLDTAIYADHVFLATAEGLLQGFIDPTDPEFTSRIYQHDETRANNITVRYGAINVSAEENGLLFGSMNPRSFSERRFFKADLKPVSDFSLRTSYADRDLLNYAAMTAPELLRANVVERELSPRTQEKYQVTGYRAPENLNALTQAALVTRKRVSNRGLRQLAKPEDMNDIEVVGNSNNHLLVASSGRLRVISMTVESSVAGDTPDDIQASPTKGYSRTLWDRVDPAEILQTLPIRSGFIVEYPNSLGLITKDGSFTLSNEAVAQVRTFASSRQFKDVVAAVEESCIALTGYYLTEDTLF